MSSHMGSVRGSSNGWSGDLCGFVNSELLCVKFCNSEVSHRAWMVISTVGVCTTTLLSPLIPLLLESSRQMKLWCSRHGVFHVSSQLWCSHHGVFLKIMCSFRDWMMATQRAKRKRDSVWRAHQLPREGACWMPCLMFQRSISYRSTTGVAQSCATFAAFSCIMEGLNKQPA